MLLQRMGAFGVRYAEIGFAGANQFVSDLTGALSGVDTGAMKLALFGRTRGRGTKVEEWPDVKFIIANRKRVPVAVIVVKSRLLDIAKSLETTPEENLLMVSETIQCLQDNGLEVMVDFEHAMDAACGRRENGNPCDADSRKRGQDYFHQMVDQCVRDRSEPAGGVRYQWRRQPGRGDACVHAIKRKCIRKPLLDFTGTPIAGWESPIAAPQFLPAPFKCKARCWEPASDAATLT